jgi:hypothetical protein
LVKSSGDTQAAGTAVAVDIRGAELEAMTDVFLGEDYDPIKRKQIDDLHVAMRQGQVRLSQRHREGKLNAEEYVDACSTLIADTFKQFEAVLGPADFRKLVGSSRQDAAKVINRETFLGVHGAKAQAVSRAACYANFCRVSVTPEELILDFGLNTQTVPSPEKSVDLTSRVVMNFFTAKRLMQALQSVVSRHEQTFGALEVDVRKRAGAVKARASRPS